MDQDLLLDMRRISKGFPGVKALDEVDFSLKKGEVHVLIGENGAGKSTLIKILSGAYTADSGEILDDRPFERVGHGRAVRDEAGHLVVAAISETRSVDHPLGSADPCNNGAAPTSSRSEDSE